MTQPDIPTPDHAALSAIKRRTPVGRAWARFATDPSSTRNAIVVIIVANLTTVLAAGVVLWLLDRHEYEEITEAFWYTLQTITTVGYGDVTPAAPVGRFVGAVVMLLGIASLSILTATITSSFIEARQSDRHAREAAEERAFRVALEARLDDLIARLDRLDEARARPGSHAE